ncbi:MAG: hypothetical protein ACE37F_12605 [Nannocystaceae bacterium]|nr:hypothetical protein [bacterium]
MSRTKTFEFGGWIVSVVPHHQLRRVRSPKLASEIVRSAEARGGASLLFDILGHWAPLGPTRREDLRALVRKEILDYSELWRVPVDGNVIFDAPPAVDLRDLIQPVPLGADTVEPTAVAEPAPWIELEVKDSRGRAVEHFTASLRSPGASRDVSTAGVVHETLETEDPLDVTLRVRKP